MVLTDKQKAETGAFYTPKIWADKAVAYIKKIIPNLEDYIFWDVAAGEGALLDALPKGCKTYATTLEREDFYILRDKDYDCNQFDFLSGDLSRLDFLRNIDKRKLIVFTNPPYFTIPSKDYIPIKNKYKSNDATALFYYRIIKEIKPLLLCSFNKIDLFATPKHKQFRADTQWHQRCLSLFVSPSQSWGLKGSFPIAFNIIYTYE